MSMTAAFDLERIEATMPPSPETLPRSAAAQMPVRRRKAQM
jgi:hypothetical protein